MKSSPFSSATVEQANFELRKAELKVTPARRAVLCTLIENHGPFTAEQLHQKVGKRDHDLVTIYRTLTSLQAAKLLERIDFHDGTSHYEYSGLRKHHHHVICTECGEIEKIDVCPFQSIDKRLVKQGYNEVTHSLSYFAICPNCN